MALPAVGDEHIYFWALIRVLALPIAFGLNGREQDPRLREYGGNSNVLASDLILCCGTYLSQRTR